MNWIHKKAIQTRGGELFLEDATFAIYNNIRVCSFILTFYLTTLSGVTYPFPWKIYLLVLILNHVPDEDSGDRPQLLVTARFRISSPH